MANVKLVAEIVLDGANKVTKKLKDVQKELEKTDKIDLSKISAGFDKIALAAAGVSVASLKVAADFDTGVRKVNTLLDEGAESAINWKEEYKTAAIETGQSLGNITDATYQAISAGVNYEDAIGFVTTQNQLAIAGQTDLSSAIDVTTKTLNAYGLEASDANRINDILIATQNNGITTVNELSSSLAQVTPTAAAMGVSFEQVGAALATMTAQGTPTAQATTQLNTLLAELGKEGTKASDIFKELTGQSFIEFIEAGGDVGQAIQIMEEEAKKNDKTLIDMFGSIEAGKAAMQLANGEGKEFAGNLDKMNDSAGETATAFGDMTEGSPAFMFDQLKASTQVLAANLGEQLLPAAQNVIEKLTEFTNWASENQTLVKAVAAIVLTLVGAWVALNAALAIYNTIVAIGAIVQLSFFWPIMLIIGGILLLIGVVILIISYWEELVIVAKVVWKTTLSVFKKAWDYIVNLFTAGWEWLKENWKTVLLAVLAILFGVLGLIIGLIIKYKDDILNTLKSAWEWLKKTTKAAWEYIKTSILVAWNAIKSGVYNAWAGLKNIINTAWNWVKSSTMAVWNSVKNGIVGAWNGIRTGIGNAINWIIGKIEAFKNKVISIKNTIVSAFKNIINGISLGIQSGIDTLISTVKNAVNNYAIGPLNSAIGTINKIPKVNIPNIPYLAKGGLVGVGNSGTLAMVGEAGPEAVIPLKTKVLNAIGNAIYEATSKNTAMQPAVAGGATTVNNIYNPVIDSKERLEELLRILGKEGGK